MKAAGLDSVAVMIHPDNGKGIEFIQEAPEDMIRTILDIAAEEKFPVFFMDEVAFRKGSVSQNPEIMAQRIIRFLKKYASSPGFYRVDGKPVYYGVNRVSGCVIMADRTVNRNPNGLIFGTSGSGKSVSGKQEMIYIYLTTDDQIILCDPEGEYRMLTRRLNGQTIMLSADSHDYINPMDIELEENMDDVLRLKSELILSFCEIVMDGKRNIPAEANSVIDRCLPIIYEKYIKDPKPENMPTLGDLYECLKRQPEPQVRRIVTALELYVTGSLNYFNHHTSVQLNVL